jgi:hypothetical protein
VTGAWPAGHGRMVAALANTTERLVREIACPESNAPSWDTGEWAVARAVSAMHGISALLATRLRWQGPIGWQTFLREQHRHTLVGHERVGVVLAKLARTAAQADLPLVALKGSALREFPLHAAGERPMADIDLLVRPADAARACAVITSLDYRLSGSAPRHLTFEPRTAGRPHDFAEHASNPLRIELHPRVFEELPLEPIDITAEIWPSAARPGLNPYASFAALLRHVVLHAAGNMREHTLRFIQIYDVAMLARRLRPADWAASLGATPRSSAWWMFPPLSMASRYLPGCVPAEALAEFAQLCPRRLRRRYEHCSVHEVGWSNPHAAALPGLEWSRTWREALRFTRVRVFPPPPSPTGLDQATSGPIEARHVRRILRWLFTRATRARTLAAVQAALRQTQEGSEPSAPPPLVPMGH